MPPGSTHPRVALDATPLLGQPTGVGVFCREALRALGARPDLAVEGFAVTWRRQSRLPAVLPAGVPVTGRPMPARPLHLAWRYVPFPPLELFVGSADVVHGTNFVVPPTRRAASVVTVHDLTAVHFPEMCEPATLAYPDLIRRALRRGAWVHTPSQYVADEVISVFGADPARVRAVHHGIPALPEAPPSRRAFGLPERTTRYILAVGTVEPRKDYPGLVAAFDRISSVHPDVALVIAGSDGWGSDALRAALTASPSRSRVVRPGYVDDSSLRALIEGATALAYPSRYEGFGFPPLQAMAAGVPVVATAAGAVPEVLGEAAVLVPAGDADALAGALTDVLDSPERAGGLAAAGRQQAARFSWEACAAGLFGLYRDAASETGGS